MLCGHNKQAESLNYLRVIVWLSVRGKVLLFALLTVLTAA